MRFSALIFLASCARTPSLGGDDGSGGDDTGAHSDALGDSCEPPDSPYTDPFVLLGQAKNGQDGPGGWFTEILDVSLLPDEQRVITAGQGGVVLFDVDGESPVTRGHVGVGPANFQRFYHVLPAEPGLAWATHRDFGLEALDLSDTDAPLLLGGVEGRGFEGLDRAGNRVYLASTLGEVVVVGVDDPRTPVEIGRVKGLGRPWDVSAFRDVLYVADAELGIVVLSLADPDLPVYVTALGSAGIPLRLEARDDVLYVASGAGGLEVFDLADPLAPVRARGVDPGGSALDVAATDGVVGVTTQEAVVIYDIGRAGIGAPLRPEPFAYQTTEQYAMALDGDGGDWVVGDWNILGLWSLDTTPSPAIDPAVGTVAFLDGASTVSVPVLNRGAADLRLSGVAVPVGVTADVDTVTVAPGDFATLELSWDGEAPPRGSVCIASDDPGRPQVFIDLAAGEAGEGRALGQHAPDFALVDLDGTTRRLSEQVGHPVVLAYFATW